MPGASRTRKPCVRKSGNMHTISQEKPDDRHSLRDGLTTYSAISPVFGLFSHRRRSISAFRPQGRNRISIDLTPASRGQDHAAWSYASDAHRLRPSASTAPRLTVRDDSAETSLFTRQDFGNIAVFLVFGKRKI